MPRRVIQAYQAAASGLPRRVWILCAVLLVHRAGTMVLPFLTLYLTLDRGLSLLVAGQLIGIYGLGAFLGAWLGGLLSDRIGSIRTMQLSLIGTGIAYLSILVHGPLWTIALRLTVAGLIAEAFRPAAMTTCAELTPPGLEARAFALLRLAVNLGMSLGPAVGGFLAVISYDWIFIVDAATCWLAVWIVARYLRVPAGGTSPPEEGEVQAASLSPWSDLPYLALLVWVSLYAIVFFQVFSTLPIYFKDVYGLREDRIGLVLAWNAVLIVLVELLLVQWARHLDAMRAVAIGGFVTCIGFAVMPLGTSMRIAILSVTIWTIGEMLALPILNGVVARRAGRKHLGQYMGLFTMAHAAAFVVAPMLGTWVMERFGAATLWYGCGWTGVVLLVSALMLRRSIQSPLRDPALPR